MCDAYDPISGNCKYCEMPKSLHYGNHKHKKHVEGNFGKETGLSIGGLSIDKSEKDEPSSTP